MRSQAGAFRIAGPIAESFWPADKQHLQVENVPAKAPVKNHSRDRAKTIAWHSTPKPAACYSTKRAVPNRLPFSKTPDLGTPEQANKTSWAKPNPTGWL